MKTLAERLEAKIDRSAGPDACHPFTGARQHGYGVIWTGTRMARAHRVALELHLGRPIPRELDARHSCHNRPCCNERHLSEGTRLQNMRDAVEGGRMRRGATHGSVTKPIAFRANRLRGEAHLSAKLTEGQVRLIRARVAAGESHAAAGRDFNIQRQTVRAIATRRTWRHVQGE